MGPTLNAGEVRAADQAHLIHPLHSPAETQEPYGECVNNVMIYGWTDRAGSKFDRAW